MEVMTLVIPESKNRIDDDCDVGDNCSKTWCNILSMSIGGWATASRGIGLGRVPVQ